MTAATGAIVLKANGKPFSVWTEASVTRDLSDIAGSFAFDYDDTVRYAAALPIPDMGDLGKVLLPGADIRIEVDGECVLTGYATDINLDTGPDELRASVLGFDPTIDLVECSANPQGPVEYKGLDLTGIVARLVTPFGLKVRAEVDVGDPFPLFSLDVSEPVMAAIEKAARQRGILVVSDGVGGVVLTQSGSQRGAAPLTWGDNIHRSHVQLSARGRFSHHWIKGQLPRVHKGGGGKKAAARLDASVAPLGEGAAISAPAAQGGSTRSRRHKRGHGKHGPVYQTGHATDPGVLRYRPKIWITRAQAGLDTVDEQAEWRARVTAAQADRMSYTVVGWRPATGAALWRPNTLVAVTDPLRGLNGVDQLIAGVEFIDGEQGARTVLRVVDPVSFTLDEEDVGPRRAGRSRLRHQHAVDATSRRFR